MSAAKIRESSQQFRAGIVGTGFIAAFHARAIQAARGAKLVSVCDANLQSAQSFAADWNVAATYESFEAMLEHECLDAVHILTPPDQHYSMARLAFRAGASVLIEKPMCTTLIEADELLEIARKQKLRIGVNHNFLFFGAYRILREAIRSGTLGPIDHISINYLFELPQIRLGPFDSWMLRSPQNVMLEVGSHLFSMLLDLLGPPDQLSVIADREFLLPNGYCVVRRWRIHATVGRTATDININLGPGFGQRTICVRGLVGTATLDFEANTCVIDRRSPSGPDLDRCRRSLSLSSQIRSQARTTLANYVLSKLKVRGCGNPYEMSIVCSVASFYSALLSGAAFDGRIEGEFGRKVVESCSGVIRSAGLEQGAVAGDSHCVRSAVNPTILVIGGSGFIGQELIRQLLDAGYNIRAMSRRSGAALQQFQSNRLEILRGDAGNERDLEAAMRGIEFVYYLATSEQKTWNASLRNTVEPTRLVSHACLAAGVKRLIYTGTIDCYYAGAKAGTITEATPFDKNIARRNYYARGKAAAESVLLDMHRARGLPVVIFRPGIVIGRGGNPFHWGVGKFSENVCEVWGDGNNKLPFVLVTDVASALVRGMQVESVEGRSYNLVDIPLLTAREYLGELQQMSKIRLAVHYRPIWRLYLIDLGKWMVKKATGHPDRHRLPSYRDWESRTQKATFDCTRARLELAWRPSSDRQRIVDEGLGGSLEVWLSSCG